MPAIATSKFRIHNAEQFLESFSEAANTNYYFYIGGVESFADDNNPPTPNNDTNSIEFAPWRDSIGAKRVQAGDVVQVVDRYNWTSGVVYTQYDDQDTNLLDDNFYVMTANYNVYKCLFNNGGAATGASGEPSGTNTTPFETPDGYVWKYMYTITTSDALKFLTNEFIPVRDDAAVQSAAVDGAIHVSLVTAGGTGYSSASVSIVGDGTGATATANLNGGVVESITMDNIGSGYSYAVVTITGDGSGATARAVISPKGGHGSNNAEELGAKFVMMNVRLDGTEGGTISTENDFRKVGLIRDPEEFAGGLATGSNYRQTYRYTLNSGTISNGPFVQDETVTVGSNTARVIEYDAVNYYLYTDLPLPNAFTTSDVVTGSTSGASGTISAVDQPGLKPYSGDVIYVENRSPISRATDQIEDVKLIVEF